MNCIFCKKPPDQYRGAVTDTESGVSICADCIIGCVDLLENNGWVEYESRLHLAPQGNSPTVVAPPKTANETDGSPQPSQDGQTK